MLLLLALCAFSSAGSLAATGDAPTVQSDYVRAKRQHDKLRALVSADMALKKTEQQQIHDLQEKYPNLSSSTIYQERDLTTREGIYAARQRLQRFDEMTMAVDAVQRPYWRHWERAINSNDLDQPLRQGLKSAFAAARSQIAGNYANWTQATRDSSATILQLLDIAERHVGKFSWMDGKLKTSDLAALKELEASHELVAPAIQRESDAMHTAFRTIDPTRGLIRAELLQHGEST